MPEKYHLQVGFCHTWSPLHCLFKDFSTPCSKIFHNALNITETNIANVTCTRLISSHANNKGQSFWVARMSKLKLPLSLHMYLGQWFCRVCQGYHNRAGLYECPVTHHKCTKSHGTNKLDRYIHFWIFITDCTERQGERLQDVQHGLQHPAAPKQVGKAEERDVWLWNEMN